MYQHNPNIKSVGDEFQRQLPLSVSPQLWSPGLFEIQMTTVQPTTHGSFTLQLNM